MENCKYCIITFVIIINMLLLPTNVYAGSPGIPVLLYHHINNDYDELSISPDEFDRQLYMLKKEGYSSITPEQLISFMMGDNPKLPEKPILITFDDGYEDNYTYAFPILKKHGYKAVIFMVAINIDRPERLSKRQLAEMVSSGFGIGVHSATHPNLTGLNSEKLKQEVCESKEKIEKDLKLQTSFFAYPGGFFDLASFNAVEKADYQGAFTVLTGRNVPQRDNILLMRRLPLFRSSDFSKLVDILNHNFAESIMLTY